jgi:aerobic-type carbon monoxide dehydrogenase small subunit (CoxS/CutS family)
MRLLLHVNGQRLELETSPSTRLLDVLRRAGYFGVKHGCDDGMCSERMQRTPSASRSA